MHESTIEEMALTCDENQGEDKEIATTDVHCCDGLERQAEKQVSPSHAASPFEELTHGKDSTLFKTTSLPVCSSVRPG